MKRCRAFFSTKIMLIWYSQPLPCRLAIMDTEAVDCTVRVYHVMEKKKKPTCGASFNGTEPGSIQVNNVQYD